MVTVNNREITLTLLDSSMILYTVHNQEGTLLLERKADKPAAITPRCELATSLKRIINPKGEMNRKQVTEEYTQLINDLQKEYEDLYGQYIVQQMEETNRILQEKQNRLNDAKELLLGMDQPLVYIGSLLDWMTAGERRNTLLCFCAYCSQVLLKNPISVIGLGESSSGKTFIEKTALSFIPEEFVTYERMITPAAIFNRSKEDPHFYEGKICVYGDMGGDNDQEKQSDSKDLMKELQSDGYINKPVNINDGGGNWTVVDLELFGKPCLTYTTIPNYIFDDQELSRSIIFTPRTDNKSCFLLREELLEFQGGVTHTQYKKYKAIAEKIKDVVLYLEDVLKEYIIINPYFGVVKGILFKSKYYKRDISKYNALLKVITAINFHNNIKYEDENGQKVLFTSKKDIQLFLSLIDPYLDNIRSNISPKASEILKSIKNMLSDGYYNGITTADFQEDHQELSKKSVQIYFRELNAAGFIKIVGKENRFNLYDTTSLANFSADDMKSSNIDALVKEFGDEVTELILSEKEESVELSVMDQHPDIVVPPWGCGD